MQNLYKKLGISGGTFDPIHNGHLMIAEKVRELFRLDRVLFIPTGRPPHKKGLEVTEAVHRMNMVRQAVDSNPFFCALDIEITRPGFTYTVDTLEQLREMYGGRTRFFFIVGADVVYDLPNWKDCRRVFSLCEFVAVYRPGNRREDDFNKEIQRLRQEYGAVIHVAAIPAMEISSTDIRKRVKEGRSIKNLVPESVERYIISNGLYK